MWPVSASVWIMYMLTVNFKFGGIRGAAGGWDVYFIDQIYL